MQRGDRDIYPSPSHSIVTKAIVIAKQRKQSKEGRKQYILVSNHSNLRGTRASLVHKHHPTMASLTSSTPLSFFLLLLTHHPLLTRGSTTTLTTLPSSSTYIISESSTSSLTNINGGLFPLSSNVPVTISRYNDNLYADGEQPLFPYDARIVVTSDCSTDETDVLPTITWGEEGSSAVVKVPVEDAGSGMPFLEPASYNAVWEWNQWDCGEFPVPAPVVFEDEEGAEPAFEIVGNDAPTRAPTKRPTARPAVENGGEKATPSPVPALEQNGMPFEEREYLPEDATPSAGSWGVRGRVWGYRALATAAAGWMLLGLVVPRHGGIHDGAEGGPGFGWTLGRIAVVAAASASFSGYKDGIHGNGPHAGKDIGTSAAFQPRRVQNTCTFNVELLIDGCTHPLNISAPKARIVDAVLVNPVNTSLSQGDGTCLYQYETDITFNTESSTVTDLDTANGDDVAAVDALEYGQCVRVTDGRPFVDASGESLVASPIYGKKTSGQLDLEDRVESEECEVASISRPETIAVSSSLMTQNNMIGVDENSNNQILHHTNSSTTPSTNLHHHQTTREWTQRALGEHASIASFSAFSIALLTNRAPDHLVRDALLAGLDELRHARVSFEIASLLAGQDVGPGPLPPSKHHFEHDVNALALAVAREGCVDETLSALAAAREADDLTKLLERTEGRVDRFDGTKYDGVDGQVVERIRDELRIIALEESGHSALAWRTLAWICDVDAEACRAVREEVLRERSLEARFEFRFGGQMLSADPAAVDAMRREWRSIYGVLANRSNVDGGAGLTKDEYDFICHGDDSESVLESMTTNILQRSLCDSSSRSGIIV